MPKRSLIALIAMLACLVSAAPASAALTGNYAGETTQDLGLDDPYTTKIVVTVLRGHLVGIVATVRMESPEPAVWDGRIVKGWRAGKGPKLHNGNFSVHEDGVRVSGHVGERAGSGSIRGRRGGFEGTGDWSVRKML
jgi:hypothetical protein